MKHCYMRWCELVIVLQAAGTQSEGARERPRPISPGVEMHEIPATWMRGGTSKCWVFRRADLQVGDLSIDDVLLRIFGSPDHRQVDGVGGGTSTTSKAVILAPSSAEGIDVEYTFAQVGIDEAKVDWGSNCGNCSAVVASFAIREGWVRTDASETAVRVLNTNTDQLIVQRVPTPGG